MTNEEKFKQMVSQVKLHSICGMPGSDDLQALRVRAGKLGIDPAQAEAMIAETPRADRAPSWNAAQGVHR